MRGPDTATVWTRGKKDAQPIGLLGDEEAVEIATDYLEEIGWFNGDPFDPDHVAQV